MAGRAVGELARVRVEGEEDGRRHAGVGDVAQHPPRDLGRRGVLVGERAVRVPQLAHQHGGGDAAAGHVADGEMHDPVGAAQRVVPVTADLEPDAAGAVAAGQVDAFDRGQRLGQQAALERDRDVVLLRVSAGRG